MYTVQYIIMHIILMSAIVRLMYDSCNELPSTEVTSSPNQPASCVAIYALYLPAWGPTEAESRLGLKDAGHAL